MWTIIGLIIFAGLVIGGWIWFKKHNPKKAQTVEKIETKVEEKVGEVYKEATKKTE